LDNLIKQHTHQTSGNDLVTACGVGWSGELDETTAGREVGCEGLAAGRADWPARIGSGTRIGHFGAGPPPPRRGRIDNSLVILISPIRRCPRPLELSPRTTRVSPSSSPEFSLLRAVHLTPSPLRARRDPRRPGREDPRFVGWRVRGQAGECRALDYCGRAEG
jgi:hypothetical protein